MFSSEFTLCRCLWCPTRTLQQFRHVTSKSAGGCPKSDLNRTERKQPKVIVFPNGCVWKCCVPLFTQWFCWSLSLLNGYFIGNIPNIFRQTQVENDQGIGWDCFWVFWRLPPSWNHWEVETTELHKGASLSAPPTADGLQAGFFTTRWHLERRREFAVRTFHGQEIVGSDEALEKWKKKRSFRGLGKQSLLKMLLNGLIHNIQRPFKEQSLYINWPFKEASEVERNFSGLVHLKIDLSETCSVLAICNPKFSGHIRFNTTCLDVEANCYRFKKMHSYIRKWLQMGV